MADFANNLINKGSLRSLVIVKEYHEVANDEVMDVSATAVTEVTGEQRSSSGVDAVAITAANPTMHTTVEVSCESIVTNDLMLCGNVAIVAGSSVLAKPYLTASISVTATAVVTAGVALGGEQVVLVEAVSESNPSLVSDVDVLLAGDIAFTPSLSEAMLSTVLNDIVFGAGMASSYEVSALAVSTTDMALGSEQVVSVEETSEITPSLISDVDVLLAGDIAFTPSMSGLVVVEANSETAFVVTGRPRGIRSQIAFVLTTDITATIITPVNLDIHSGVGVESSMAINSAEIVVGVGVSGIGPVAGLPEVIKAGFSLGTEISKLSAVTPTNTFAAASTTTGVSVAGNTETFCFTAVESNGSTAPVIHTANTTTSSLVVAGGIESALQTESIAEVTSAYSVSRPIAAETDAETTASGRLGLIAVASGSGYVTAEAAVAASVESTSTVDTEIDGVATPWLKPTVAYTVVPAVGFLMCKVPPQTDVLCHGESEVGIAVTPVELPVEVPVATVASGAACSEQIKPTEADTTAVLTGFAFSALAAGTSSATTNTTGTIEPNVAVQLDAEVELSGRMSGDLAVAPTAESASNPSMFVGFDAPAEAVCTIQTLTCSGSLAPVTISSEAVTHSFIFGARLASDITPDVTVVPTLGGSPEYEPSLSEVNIGTMLFIDMTIATTGDRSFVPAVLDRTPFSGSDRVSNFEAGR